MGEQRLANSTLFHRLAHSMDREEVLHLAKEGEIIECPEDILREAYVFAFTGFPQLSVEGNQEHLLNGQK